MGILFVCFFVWNVFLSSFCLTFCVCFYELGKTAPSSGLEGVALYMSNPCIDCVCQVLFGRLAGIGAGMVRGRPRMLCWGHLGGMVGAGVGMGWGCSRAQCAGNTLVGWLELAQVQVWVSWGMPCWGHFDGMAGIGVGMSLGVPGYTVSGLLGTMAKSGGGAGLGCPGHNLPVLPW